MHVHIPLRIALDIDDTCLTIEINTISYPHQCHYLGCSTVEYARVAVASTIVDE